MTKINLTAKDRAQELILAYLQENASETLAEKINNGVPVVKDGKRLKSKKDLDGFMAFANGEARKLAEKGANSACVEDSVVYGWAIHYFEENSIEGRLYNEDGTEYQSPKPVPKKKATPVAPVKVEPTKPKQQQVSLLDMLNAQNKKTAAEETGNHEPLDDLNDEDGGEDLNARYTSAELKKEPELAKQTDEPIDNKNAAKMVEPSKKQAPPFYSQYVDLKESYPDCIILIRLGDFYETFDKDAETLSDELDLTLTGREIGLESRVPMVGFPYHAADTYIAKIQKNHSTVIVESDGKIIPLAKAKLPLTQNDDGREEEIEELTESEMREFDGDIQEPKVTADEKPDDTLPYSATSFDKETMIYLYDLLDGKMNIA